MIKEIEKVKEIMSDKCKFLRNVGNVEFVFKCYSKNMNPKNLVLFYSYSAFEDEELEDFYDDYKLKGYGDMEIKRVVKLNYLNYFRKRYWVEMYEECDGYISYAEMVLDLCCDNGGQE